MRFVRIVSSSLFLCCKPRMALVLASNQCESREQRVYGRWYKYMQVEDVAA
jgi:hypothetical protein